jgi:HKD family nuclease
MIDQIKNNEINLITNDYKKSFYHELRDSFNSCKNFHISVAFINSSALGLFKEEFSAFSENRKGKIITTNYMYGTDPNALSLLAKQEYIDTRIFDAVKDHSGFHTKGYIFEMEDYYKVYVGSSNLTQSALKTNKEWNLRIISKDDSLIKMFISEFNDLWNQSQKLEDDFITEYRDAYYQKNDFKKSNMYEKIIAFIKQS